MKYNNTIQLKRKEVSVWFYAEALSLIVVLVLVTGVIRAGVPCVQPLLIQLPAPSKTITGITVLLGVLNTTRRASD